MTEQNGTLVVIDIRADLRGSGAKLTAALAEPGPKIEAAGEGLATAIEGGTEKVAKALEGASVGIGSTAPVPWSGSVPAAFAPNGRGVLLSAGCGSSVERTLGFEGGLLPRDIDGTVTNFGVNSARHPGVDVEH